MVITKLSSSEEETKKIAKEIIIKYLGQISQKCLVLALEGDLGAGKTVFAKGAAEVLEIKKVIRSPSFIIMREFPYSLGRVKGNFFHIDLWRMENKTEAENLKINELIKPGNILLVEWAEKMGESLKKVLKEKTILVSIKITRISEKQRRFEFKNTF